MLSLPSDRYELSVLVPRFRAILALVINFQQCAAMWVINMNLTLHLTYITPFGVVILIASVWGPA